MINECLKLDLMCVVVGIIKLWIIYYYIGIDDVICLGDELCL